MAVPFSRTVYFIDASKNGKLHNSTIRYVTITYLKAGLTTVLIFRPIIRSEGGKYVIDGYANLRRGH